MLKQIFSLAIALSFLFPSLALASDHDQNRVFTPSPDSPTAVARSGADLEELKQKCNCNTKYVATGEEKIDWIRGYNPTTKKFFRDEGHNHRFAKGSILWMNSNGTRGVAVGCMNDFGFHEPVGLPRQAQYEQRDTGADLEGREERSSRRTEEAEEEPPPRRQQRESPPEEKKKGGGCGAGCKTLIGLGIAGVVIAGVAVAKKGGNKDSSINIVNNNSNTNSNRNSARAQARNQNSVVWNTTQTQPRTRREVPSRTESGKTSDQKTTPVDGQPGVTSRVAPRDGRNPVENRPIQSTGTSSLNLDPAKKIVTRF